VGHVIRETREEGGTPETNATESGRKDTRMNRVSEPSVFDEHGITGYLTRVQHLSIYPLKVTSPRYFLSIVKVSIIGAMHL
jgi:hypothetical protein